MTFKKYSCWKKKIRLLGWKRVRILILFLSVLVLTACNETIRQHLFEDKQLVVVGTSSQKKNQKRIELQEALALFHSGRLVDAQQILNDMSHEASRSDDIVTAAFYLGLIKLLVMGDVSEMKACKNYFSGYASEYPDGPFRENSDKIIHSLTNYIGLAEKDNQRIKELVSQVEKQNKEIEILKYQIQKLEEIQQETERERQLLELN